MGTKDFASKIPRYPAFIVVVIVVEDRVVSVSGQKQVQARGTTHLLDQLPPPRES
jgi:hypothetical protein